MSDESCNICKIEFSALTTLKSSNNCQFKTDLCIPSLYARHVHIHTHKKLTRTYTFTDKYVFKGSLKNLYPPLKM